MTALRIANSAGLLEGSNHQAPYASVELASLQRHVTRADLCTQLRAACVVVLESLGPNVVGETALLAAASAIITANNHDIMFCNRVHLRKLLSSGSTHRTGVSCAVADHG